VRAGDHAAAVAVRAEGRPISRPSKYLQ
jgi:hypothetical protein